MDMRLLVQTRDKLDAAKAVKFIDSCKDAKLALIHASLHDEVALLDVFQDLLDNLRTPFIGTRVSGSATPDGYFEDAVAIAVLCGDFDVNVFHEKINFQNPEETANKITPQLGDADLCLVHSANHYKQNVIMDGILRRVQNAHPKIQVIGGASAPPTIVAVKDGIYGDHIAVAAIKGLNYEFKGYSTCKIDEASKEEFIITKADEYHIYEINNRDAVEEYSRIQHMRPYFLNMITNYVLTRSDILKVVQGLAGTGGTLREGLLKLGINLLGRKNKDGFVETAMILELNEEGRRYAGAQNYIPAGTKFRRAKHSVEEANRSLDQIAEYSKDQKTMLIMVCAAIYWIYLDLDDLKNRISKIHSNFLLSFVFGEYGAIPPYKGLDQNVVHGAMLKTLAFK